MLGIQWAIASILGKPEYLGQEDLTTDETYA